MKELRLNDKFKSFISQLNPRTIEKKETVALLPISDNKKEGLVLLREVNETGETLFGDNVTRQVTKLQASFRLKSKIGENRDV
jgi:hypothetical protein